MSVCLCVCVSVCLRDTVEVKEVPKGHPPDLVLRLVPVAIGTPPTIFQGVPSHNSSCWCSVGNVEMNPRLLVFLVFFWGGGGRNRKQKPASFEFVLDTDPSNKRLDPLQVQAPIQGLSVVGVPMTCWCSAGNQGKTRGRGTCFFQAPPICHPEGQLARGARKRS